MTVSMTMPLPLPPNRCDAGKGVPRTAQGSLVLCQECRTAGSRRDGERNNPQRKDDREESGAAGFLPCATVARIAAHHSHMGVSTVPVLPAPSMAGGSARTANVRQCRPWSMTMTPTRGGSRLRSFPVCEDDGIIWIYMGIQPAHAPPVPELMAQRAPLSRVAVCVLVEATYDLCVLSLIDPGHVGYVHNSSVVATYRDSARKDQGI